MIQVHLPLSIDLFIMGPVYMETSWIIAYIIICLLRLVCTEEKEREHRTRCPSCRFRTPGSSSESRILLERSHKGSTLQSPTLLALLYPTVLVTDVSGSQRSSVVYLLGRPPRQPVILLVSSLQNNEAENIPVQRGQLRVGCSSPRRE